jgi:hypothetical protein
MFGQTLPALFAAGLLLAAMTPAAAQQAPGTVALYKNPQCGCCENYADYLREQGFTVTVTPTHDLVSMSSQAGIPEDFQGCHLAFIEGYAVSGHVPMSVIQRLLDERPAVKAITLPGMPMGSPGMGGVKEEPFTVYQVGEGAPEVYAVE